MSRRHFSHDPGKTITLRAVSGLATVVVMSMIMRFAGCPGGSVTVTCPLGTVMVGQTIAVSATPNNAAGTVRYLWTASPAGSGAFGDASARNTTFTPLMETTITLTVTATDSSGSVNNSCSILVEGVIDLIADASGPSTLEVGQSGSVSVGVTGAIGPPGIAWTANQGAFSNANSANTTFTPDAPGTATVTVTVTDGARTATDSFNVTVTQEVPQEELTVSISGPMALDQGETGTYTASVTNAGDSGATFAWSVTGPATLNTATGQSVVLTGTGGGTAILTVTATDNSSGRTATDDFTVTVTALVLPPAVTITANPDTFVFAGDALELTCNTVDPQGLSITSILWTLVSADPPLMANPLSNPSGAVTNFNTDSPGIYTVQCSATNAAGVVGMATVDLIIDPGPPPPCTLIVNGGADRQLSPNAADFTGAVFGPGSQLQSGQPGGAVPNLTAIATLSSCGDLEMFFTWEVMAVPDGANINQVVLLDSSAGTTGFVIAPAPSNSSLTLNEAGMTGSVTNVVIPGDYMFTVTVVDVIGDTATDDIVFSIMPAFTMVPTAAGVQHGLSLGRGCTLRHVVRPSADSEATLRLLARVTGTLSFSLVDAGDMTNAGALAGGAGFYGGFSTDAVAPQSQDSLDIAPADPVAVVDETLTLMSANRGTYLLQGRLSAGVATVDSTFLGEDENGDNDVLDAGDLPWAVHASPELGGAVDTRAPFDGSTLQHFGLVNSANSTSAALPRTQFHGARAAAGGNEFWDGEVIVRCDVNNDGWPEVVTADGNVITILRGLADDPADPVASPLDNSINNGGLLTENNPGLPGTLDTFALTDANMAGTVANVTQVTALACGDLDGDGLMDMVVGEGGFDGGAGIGAEGRVLVFYGQGFDGFDQNPFTADGVRVSGGAQLARPAAITRPDGVINGVIGRDDRFGHALAVCNFNNDVFDDLIVGAPGGGQAVTVDAAGIRVNGAGQVTQTLMVDTVSATTIFEPGDIAVVDVNDTAQSLVRRVTAAPSATTIAFDLAMGVAPADDETVDEIIGMTGAVFGFNGRTARLPNAMTVDDSGAGASFRIIPSSSRSGDLVGVAIACGDISGDGIDDIVFGAAGRKDSAATARVAAGAVFVTNGRIAGLSGNVHTIDRFFEGNAAHLGFGRAVAVGDFDGAIGMDIAVSAAVAGGDAPSLAAAGAGRVYIISSTTQSIQSAFNGDSALSTVPQVSGAAADGNLGVRLAAYDFNGDGADDLAVTAPSVTGANQRAYLINGATTLPASLTFAATVSNGANPAGGWLNQPTGSTLTHADSPLDLRTVLYFADGLGFVDVNGDWVDSDGDGVDDLGRNTLDMVFQGDAAVANPAYAIMGAQFGFLSLR